MSKRILFLYRDAAVKNELEHCEEVIRLVLRKFRKSAVFSYMQPDLSPSCRSYVKEALFSQAERSDAVIWNSTKEKQEEETAFAADCLGIFAKEHFTSGKCICSPLSPVTVEDNDNMLLKTEKIPYSSAAGAARLAVAAAGKRKRSVTLCTDAESVADGLLFREFEYAMGGARLTDTAHYSFDEMIFYCMRKLPPCDVLLTTQDKAHILAMHMSAMQKFPTGYVVWHGESLRIYRREFFPHEEVNNSGVAGFLLSCGSALENELQFSGAGAWLRRCVTLTLEKCAVEKRSDFYKQLLYEIDTPIRNRQVISDDSQN